MRILRNDALSRRYLHEDINVINICNNIELYIKDHNFEPFDLFYNYYRQIGHIKPCLNYVKGSQPLRGFYTFVSNHRDRRCQKHCEKRQKLDFLLSFFGRVKNLEYFKFVFTELFVPLLGEIMEENIEIPREIQIEMFLHVLEHLPSDFDFNFLAMLVEDEIHQYLILNVLEFIIVELANARADKFLLEILKYGVLPAEFIKKSGNEILQFALKRKSEEIIVRLIETGCKANEETLLELEKTLRDFNLPKSKVEEIMHNANAVNPVSLKFLMRIYVNKNVNYTDLPEEIKNTCIMDFLNFEHN